MEASRQGRLLGTAVLLVILLAGSGQLPCASGQTTSSLATSATNLPSSVELGMSVTTLTPANQGVPIYTFHDQLWVMLNNQSGFAGVALTSPSGSQVASLAMAPNLAAEVYSFPTGAQVGTWALSLVPSSSSSSGSPTVIPVEVVGDDSVPSSLESYSLTDGDRLTMNFFLNDSAAYDIESCLVGSNPPQTTSVSLPSGLGAGSLLLTRNASVITLLQEGTSSSSFNFWIELHQAYGYAVGSTIVSKDVLAARTAAVPLTESFGTLNVTLLDAVHLRTGRFTLRAYFDSPGGLTASQTTILLDNSSSWLPLQGCSSSQQGGVATAYSMTQNLGPDTSTWPRALYTLYSDHGVDRYSAQAIGILPFQIDVVAMPWRAPMDLPASSLQPNTEIVTAAASGGTLNAIARSYPVNVDLLLQNDTFLTLAVDRAFSVNTLEVATGKLIVTTLMDASPASSVGVTVMAGNRTVGSGSSGSTGQFIFYLPAGNYTVTGSVGNSTDQKHVVVDNGKVDTVSLPFGSSITRAYSYSLLVSGVIGIAASALVWVGVYRRRSRF